MSGSGEFVIPFKSLPAGFAETIADPPTVPITPVAAATIVLLRDAEAGLELLLMRRSPRSGFVPGAYVFPGGRVDKPDSLPALIALLENLDRDSAEKRLGQIQEPPAIAYYIAALREAFEETGILIGVQTDGSAPATAAEDSSVDEIRDSLMSGRIDFYEVVQKLGCRIAGDTIEYISHWITPELEPRRYDTRFFAAKVHPGATPIVDSREMTEALWISPRAALTRLDQGELPMVFPTIKTIESLSLYESADAALEGFGKQSVRSIMPTLVVTPTGIGLEIDQES